MPANDDLSQPATKQDVRDAIREALDRAVEFIAAEFSKVRQELTATRQEITARMDASDRRADRVAETLRSIDQRMSAMTRWSDTMDRDNAALAANYHSHDRAIRDLNTRLERVERELHPNQPNQ